MGFFDGGFGGVVSGVLGALGGAAGSALDASHDRDLARLNANFQREVYQNQLQWKAADAKKAGLHPIAALGGGSYSASNIASGPSSSYADSLGKLGKGIGDAFAAYKNRDQLQAEAEKKKQQEDDQAKANVELTRSQTAYYNSLSAESQRRSASQSTRPSGSGIPGQRTDRPHPGSGDAPDRAWIARDLGEGWFDINQHPDYTQELGDEIGQMYNFVRKATREADRYWQDPYDGIWYKFYPDRGAWRRENPAGDAIDELRNYNNKKNQINRRFGSLFGTDEVYRYW